MRNLFKLILVTICLIFCALVPRVWALDKIRVGVILPLTGRAASAGNGIKNGIELARRELPSDITSKVEINYEDDGSESKNTIAAYNKFLASRVDLVVTAFSNAGHAVAPLAEKDRLFHVSLAVDTSISEGRNYTFSLWARLSDSAALAIKECELRGYKRIAAVVTSHEGNLAMLRALAKAAEGKVEIVTQEEILPDERDFAQAILRVRSHNNVDAIANLLHPAQMGVFARRAKQLGLTLPEFAVMNFEDRAIVKDAGGALDGQWYIGADYSERFVPDYRSAFPESTILGAAYGHDLFLFLAKATQVTPPVADLGQYLRSLHDFSGAAKHVSSGPGNTFEIGVAVKIVGKDGLSY